MRRYDGAKRAQTRRAAGLVATLATVALAVGPAIAAPHGGFGGESAGHIGGEGVFNSNGPNGLDRDFGRDRAEDRGHRHGHGHGHGHALLVSTLNSNGSHALIRTHGRFRAGLRSHHHHGH